MTKSKNSYLEIFKYLDLLLGTCDNGTKLTCQYISNKKKNKKRYEHFKKEKPMKYITERISSNFQICGSMTEKNWVLTFRHMAALLNESVLTFKHIAALLKKNLVLTFTHMAALLKESVPPFKHGSTFFEKNHF